MLKKDVISRRNWHSFQDPSASNQNHTKRERQRPRCPQPQPETAQNAKIKLFAKTAQYRNQISTLLGVSPLKFFTPSLSASRRTPQNLIADNDGSPLLSARRRNSIPRELRKLPHNHLNNASESSQNFILDNVAKSGMRNGGTRKLSI